MLSMYLLRTITGKEFKGFYSKKLLLSSKKNVEMCAYYIEAHISTVNLVFSALVLYSVHLLA
jgi:hypothetical protein